MKHSTFILLLLFSLSVLSFSQESGENAESEFTAENAEDYQACDPNNRPQACTQESNPVCGYIHDCEGGACTNTFGNDCEACSQANVDGYAQGACDSIQTVCDSSNRPEMCPSIDVPVCAVAANCEGPHCFEDIWNSCMACSQDNVAYSVPGACPYNNRDTRTYCEWNNLSGDCTEEFNPVCAHRLGCVGNSCYFTVGNLCRACSNANVDYHTPGECSENEENRTYCDANNRPETCAEEFTVVCAHKTDCEGDDCYYTAGNPCTACVDSTVDWHTEGKCLNENNEGGDDEGKVICNPDNRPDGCDQEAYNPVCAHRPGCESSVCEYTAANHCSACNDIYVNNHTPGQC